MIKARLLKSSSESVERCVCSVRILTALLAVWFHLMSACDHGICDGLLYKLNFKGKPIGKNLEVEHYKILEIVFTAIFILDIVVRAAVAERVSCFVLWSQVR